MAAPVLFVHPSSADHDTGQHPEQPARILAVLAELERRSYLGYEVLESPAVPRAILERVHPTSYVEGLERLCVAGGGSLDPDTVVSPRSFEAAVHGCGGAVAMVERLMEQGAGAVGFSAHRPPGHHALPSRAMGFCLFNNLAVAARHGIEACGARRVMILDWDVHHGNGTNDVFSDCADVLFVSLHQWPLYPGTGAGSDVGVGRGRGYTVNLPLPSGTGDREWLEIMRQVVLPIGRSYEPDLLLLSAGFDAHAEDPLADCRVSDAGFAAMAAIARDLAGELQAPIGGVLEGGYAVDALARCVALTLEVLAGGDGNGLLAPEDGAGGEIARAGARACGVADALVLEARARLRELWPVLG